MPHIKPLAKTPQLGQLMLAAASLLPVPALAAETLTETDFFSEIPVVLSGTRLHQSLQDSPAAITVLDREMIEASGAREVYELLRFVPGFLVGSESGHNHTITSHGLSDNLSRRMQVLVDGRSVYNAAFGGVSWTDLPLAVDDIERIEVIRGPNAATHGSNAFLGVISIITRPPGTVPNHSMRLTKGNEGIGDAFYRLGGRDERLDYRLSLGFLSDDGFDNRHDAKIVRMANLAANYQLNLRDRLELQFGYSEGPRENGFPNSLNSETRTTDKRYHFQQLRWRRVESTEDEWSLQFYHNYERLSETRSGQGIESFDAGGTPERYDLEFYRTRRHQPDLRTVWGLGARRDKFSSEAFMGDGDSRSNDVFRAFGNIEWRLAPAWLMNLGAMGEHTDISGSTLSPRLALNYRLSPTQTLRAAASQSYRTPVFFEQDADFSINLSLPGSPSQLLYRGSGNLDPERIRSLELGYLGEFSGRRLTLDLRLYRDSLRDLVTEATITPPVNSPPIVTSRTFINDEEATVKGLEAQLQWRPAAGSLLQLSYAWTDVDSKTDALEDSAPRHTLSLLGSYRFNDHLSGSAAWFYVDDLTWLGSAADPIPSRDRLDLRLAYNFRLGDKTMELSGVVQNPFGDYREFRYDETDPLRRNVFDTRAYASLRMDF